VIGTPLLRRENPALLTGEAKFTSDLQVPGALHLGILRGPYANARIQSVDVSAARREPGVVAAHSGADLESAWAGPMPCAWPVTADMKNPTHYPLAVSQACYAGDGVAAGLATSAAAAHDADGNLKTSNLADYLVPAASDGPPITTDHTVTPSPTDPLGAKGIGEAGTIGAAPAVVNAIVEALSGVGVRDVPMPASPETVWKTIQAATGGSQ
jgi:CO/xanthine dehydrogenase Mo-binding subunit